MKNLSSILLVDDNETTNYINTFVIKKAGFTDELLVALNGREAIDLVIDRCKEAEKEGVSRVPQLILLDINMPVMDGFEFLDILQKTECVDKASVVVAVLTTSLNARDLERIKKLGVTEFLSKPLSKGVLESLIAKHFN